MSLGLSIYHTGGEFSPRIQYNAASGRFSRVDKASDGVTIIRAEYPMNQPPVFALDIGTMQVGWLQFGAGTVSIIVVPYGQPMPARPDRGHKAGFRAKVWEGPGRGALEFSANAGATVNAIEELWGRLMAAPEAAAGLVPVIRVVNTVSVGKNYAPVFDLLQWVERDEAVFGPRTVAAPGAPPIFVQPAAPTPAPTPAILPPPAWQAATPAPIPAAWPTPSMKAA